MMFTPQTSPLIRKSDKMQNQGNTTSNRQNTNPIQNCHTIKGFGARRAPKLIMLYYFWIGFVFCRFRSSIGFVLVCTLPLLQLREPVWDSEHLKSKKTKSPPKRLFNFINILIQSGSTTNFPTGFPCPRQRRGGGKLTCCLEAMA